MSTTLTEHVRSALRIPAHAAVVERNGETWAEWQTGSVTTRQLVDGGSGTGWRTAATVGGTMTISPAATASKPAKPAKPARRKMKGAGPVSRVVASADCWRQILQMPRSRPVETAGIAWGRRTNGTIRLEAFREVTSAATASSVRIDHVVANEEDERQRRLGRTLLAVVHTHPSATGWTGPSDSDLRAMREFSRRADGGPVASITLSRGERTLDGKQPGWRKPHTSTFVLRHDRDGRLTADVLLLEVEAGWKL